MFGNPNTYRKCLNQTEKTLDSRLESLELVCHVSANTKEYVLTHLDEFLNAQQKQLLDALVQKRLEGEPLQYLLGEWEFYGFPFRVGPGVLIPRADTELLVEICSKKLATSVNPTILDLCSGSGCIAIALKKLLPSALVTAVELSADAFSYLEENIRLNDVAITALQADAFTYTPDAPLDLLVSNPPYIPTHDLDGLQLEVQQEPQLSLDGGTDGLVFYRMIAQRYYEFLKPNGLLAFEIGYDQGEHVPSLLEEYGYHNIELFCDLSDLPRVVTAYKK